MISERILMKKVWNGDGFRLMENIIDNIIKFKYYIFVNGGDRTYLLGSDGKYLEDNNVNDAMTFSEILDAITYIEKRGLQRLATIRKVRY